MNYNASSFLKQSPAVTLPLRDLILQRFHLFYNMLSTCSLLLKYYVPLSCNHFSRASDLLLQGDTQTKPAKRG